MIFRLSTSLATLSCFLALSACLPAGADAQEPPYRLFEWERGIGLHPSDSPEMKVYLWFYEWNMFGAVNPEQHSRGDWENPVTVFEDGSRATIDGAPFFQLHAAVDDTGAELTLVATNSSPRDWPELAGIVACFNPGPAVSRNEQFASENTFFRGPEGLHPLKKREIHWNDHLRKLVQAVQPDGILAWDDKWPTGAPNATGGFMMRESRDGTWRTGIAWERFLSCQGHNPWQCMHLGIHLGPLAVGEERTVRGRIYLSKEAAPGLLDQYERDFPRPDQMSNARKAAPDIWLENMVVHHRFSPEEVRAATGLGEAEIKSILRDSDWTGKAIHRSGATTIKVLPYPGGRHPRIGFLEGAVRPQRETKLSVFTPWDAHHYVVADVPEAIWYNRENGERELLYLAHTHVPTRWTRKNVALEPLEWKRSENGSYTMVRNLPNGVEFGTRATPSGDHLALEQWLTNGTDGTLTGLRVQNCVMLKGAPEFSIQSNDNKIFRKPYAACRDQEGKRWVITAWEMSERPWGNARCPCLHSDPRFPDCPPGDTVRLRGWLSFFEGEDVEAEFDRISSTGWDR